MARINLRAERVLTGGRGELLTDVDVVVDSGVILGLEGANRDAGDVVDYGPDTTLLPGLIDTHVHLAFDGSEDPLASLLAADEAALLSTMKQNAADLLDAGVTTARDLGAPRLLDIEVKRAIESGEVRGPRLLTVGHPLTTPGGHCHFLGGEAATVPELEAAVRRLHEAGVDHIKIMATGGGMTPGSRSWEAQYDDASVRAVVDVAHALGMKVAAHCHGADGVRAALSAGVDSIEHFSFLDPEGKLSADEDLVTMAADRRSFVCRTPSVAWCTFVNDMPPGEHFIPADQLRTQADRGIRFVAGTDAGIAGVPHIEYVVGLEAMAAFGLSRAEVLYSATVEAAESLGLGDRVGRVAPEYAADLVVVRGNPLDRIGDLRNVIEVVAGGVRHQPIVRAVRSWNDEVAVPRCPESATDA